MMKIESQADIEKILTLISGIKGQKCWDTGYVHVSAIALYFGRKVYYKPTNKYYGEWWLSTWGANFVLLREGQLLVTRDDEPEEIEKQLRVMRETFVEDIEIDTVSLGLTVKFSNEIRLEILVTPEDDEFNHAYWDIRGPDRKVILVGPNRHWNIKQE